MLFLTLAFFAAQPESIMTGRKLIQSQREFAFAEAQSPKEAAAILQNVLRNQSSGGSVKNIKADKSILLFNSWQRLSKNTHKSSTTDEIARFVGSCESILGEEIPQTWIDAIYNSEQGWKSFRPLRRVSYAEIGGGCRSRNAGILIDNSSITIQLSRDKRVSIPNSEIGEIIAESVDYVPSKHGAAVALAFPSLGSTQYKLVYCADLKKKWQSEVWASGLSASSGQSHHYVDLRITDMMIIVFGCDSYSIYIEAFDLNDGRPLVRFNSRGWSK